MEFILLVSLVVVMVFSCAMCIGYRELWKETDKELQDLKFVNKLKENIQIKKQPLKRTVKSEITIGKTQADFLCMLSDSNHCMKNIEAALAIGDTNQADAYRNHFINIIAPKYINDRNPESFIYVADMFDALASKKIFEQRCKKQRKNS